jgi:TRAP-type C4-dicarboxylate transport system permease small subunit
VDTLREFVNAVARIMAILGGLVLTALVILTCVSVLGRGLNTLGHSDLLETSLPGFATWLIGTGVGPVSGDFELVQAGMAFTIFAFLPICQFKNEHATVDIFTNALPQVANRWLAVFWEIMLSLVIIIIGWRLFEGLAVKIDNGQTTFLLQFPVWWAYAASFAAAVVAGLVGVYCAIGRLMDATSGTQLMTDGAETGQ